MASYANLRPVFFTTTLVALALASAAPRARAQSNDEGIMATRLHLRGVLTAGGSARLEVNGDSADDDLVLGGGGAVEVEVPLVRFFSLGGGVTVTAWQADVEDDDVRRNLVTDLDVVPRLRLPFGGSKSHGAIYLGMPIGVAIDFPSSDYADAVDALGGDLSNGVGLHVGGRAGGQVFFTRHFGLVGEVGVDYRTMSHRIEALGGDERFMLRMTHFTAQAGLIFAL